MARDGAQGAPCWKPLRTSPGWGPRASLPGPGGHFQSSSKTLQASLPAVPLACCVALRKSANLSKPGLEIDSNGLMHET